LAAALLLAAPVTQAYEKGDWIVQAGVGVVDPKSDNGEVVSVDSGTSLIVSGEYMFSDNWGFEILGAWPFSHDITLSADGSKVAEASHLPPTFSFKYHFGTNSAFNPYLGAGLNYTIFFDESTTGALAGTDLDLDDSFGIAAQAGFDYAFNDTIMLNVQVRWMNIETDAELDGVFVETVEIDPVAWGVNLGWRF
jgi:outer membrane protein